MQRKMVIWKLSDCEFGEEKPKRTNEESEHKNAREVHWEGGPGGWLRSCIPFGVIDGCVLVFLLGSSMDDKSQEELQHIV